jgi:hypothetical protein
MLKGKEYYKSKSNVILIPKYVMFKYEPYKILKCHIGYHIKSYYIVVNNKSDNIIQEIIISDCCHPNAYGGENTDLDLNKPPKFSKFCLPKTVTGSKLISDKLMKKYQRDVSIRPDYNIYSNKHIRYMLKSWAMDDPHHYPLRSHVTTNPPLPRELM